MADGRSSPQIDGGEFSGTKPKSSSSSSSVAPSTRIQRNQAEKKRRDRLNSYISELANIVPMVNSADKTLDKVSILRLSAAYLRLNKSCLHPQRFKSKMVSLPSLVLPHLDLIERSTGGFVVVTTFAGVVLYCSNSIHDYLGYQNIDVIGNSIYGYIHKDDSSRFERKMNSVISRQKKSKKRSKVLKAHVQQKPIPRSNDVKFRKMVFKLSVHVNELTEGGVETSIEKKKKIGRTKDFGTNAIVLMFVEPIKVEPEPDAIFIESHQEGYFTMHGLRGEILYADQRITTITGYTSTDVKGKSAYEYIFSSDVPIALFAQKDMFSSQDGTGIITYRLRVKNLRYIYLQSKGQIVYGQDTKSISHFVCFNKLLSDEEGREELTKFQQRFAPLAMAANALTSKQKDACSLTFPDEILESTVPLFNNSSLHQVIKKSSSSTSSVNINNSQSVPCDISTHISKSSNNVTQMSTSTEASDLISLPLVDNISSHYSSKDFEGTIPNYDASPECSIIFPQSSSNSNTINSFTGCSTEIFAPMFENCLDTSLGSYQSNSVQNGITQNLAITSPTCPRQVVPQNVFTDNIFPSANSFEGLPRNCEFLSVQNALNSGQDIPNVSSDPFEIENFLNDQSDIHQNTSHVSEELLDFVNSNTNVAANNAVGLASTNYMSSPKAAKPVNVLNENNFGIHQIVMSKNKDFHQRELNNHNISHPFTQSNAAAKSCQTIPLNELHMYPEPSDFICTYSENIQNPADCISVPIQPHSAVYPNVRNGKVSRANGSKNIFPQVSSGVINDDINVNNTSLSNDYLSSSYSATTMVDDELNLVLGQSYDIPTKRKRVETTTNICSDSRSVIMSNFNFPQNPIGHCAKSNEYQSRNVLSWQTSMISSENLVKSNESSLSNELYYELDMFFQKLPNPLSSKLSNNDALLQNYNSTSPATARNSNSDFGFLSQ